MVPQSGTARRILPTTKEKNWIRQPGAVSRAWQKTDAVEARVERGRAVGERHTAARGRVGVDGGEIGQTVRALDYIPQPRAGGVIKPELRVRQPLRIAQHNRRR